MRNNMPSVAKKHHESTEPESHQMAKNLLLILLLLLLLLFFSDGLVQICVTLDGFHTNSSILH